MPGRKVSSKSSTCPAVPSATTGSPAADAPPAAGSANPPQAQASQSVNAARYATPELSGPAAAVAPASSAGMHRRLGARLHAERVGDQLVRPPARAVVVRDRDHDHLLGAVGRGDRL